MCSTPTSHRPEAPLPIPDPQPPTDLDRAMNITTQIADILLALDSLGISVEGLLSNVTDLRNAIQDAQPPEPSQ